ncbi:MAG: glycoside hydrolase family 43 protein [Solirubrobacteraceae bacterium]
MVASAAAAAVLPPLPPLPHLFGPGEAAPPRPSRPPVPKCTALTGERGRDRVQSVFPCDFPDPSVLKVGKTWYAYSTATGWEHQGRSMPILRSTDFRHWRSAGDAIGATPRWVRDDVWAPTVIATRHGYILYFSARRARGNVHCLVAATSRRPAGPFRVRAPLSCGDRSARGYIDPAPVRDRRGRIFLYFSVDGPHHSISVLPLSRDGVHLAGRRHELFRVSHRWQRGLDSSTVEGPSPVWHHGRLFLFYSTGSWVSDYRMGYATARSPLGPFRDYGRNPILRPGRSLIGPGGGTIFTGPHGSTWLAFHAWTGAAGYTRGGQRTLRMAPVRWSGDRARVDLGP